MSEVTGTILASHKSGCGTHLLSQHCREKAGRSEVQSQYWLHDGFKASHSVPTHTHTYIHTMEDKKKREGKIKSMMGKTI